MNGFDVLAQSKENPETKDIPFIIMSNCGGDEDIRKGLDLGAKKYLVKADTQLSDIVAEVEKYL
jgi:CheY-like chemotaxis protein